MTTPCPRRPPPTRPRPLAETPPGANLRHLAEVFDCERARRCLECRRPLGCSLDLMRHEPSFAVRLHPIERIEHAASEPLKWWKKPSRHVKVRPRTARRAGSWTAWCRELLTKLHSYHVSLVPPPCIPRPHRSADACADRLYLSSSSGEPKNDADTFYLAPPREMAYAPSKPPRTPFRAPSNAPLPPCRLAHAHSVALTGTQRSATTSDPSTLARRTTSATCWRCSSPTPHSHGLLGRAHTARPDQRDLPDGRLPHDAPRRDRRGGNSDPNPQPPTP